MKKYEIEIFGWGAEIVVGTVDLDLVNNVHDIAEENGFDNLSEVFYDVDEYSEYDLLDWYEYDNLYHNYGPYPLDCKIVVTDSESGEEVLNKPFNELKSYDDSPYNEEYHDVEEDAILFGRTEDKGLVFQTDIEVEGDFDEKLLTFALTGVMVDDDGESTIVVDFKYNGQEIHNEGMATDNKSFEVYIYE